MQYYPTAAALTMEPLDNDACHRLNVTAEYKSFEYFTPSYTAMKQAAKERGLTLVAEKFVDADRQDQESETHGIALFVAAARNGTPRFVLGYGRLPGWEDQYDFTDLRPWTERDGFDNDLRRWAEWDRDHAPVEAAVA